MGGNGAGISEACEAIRIGGIAPLSTVDFPGELAAVIFCQGCPWNCGYCQNSHLIPARGDVRIPWLEVERLLQSRSGLLDAVVFSGGEPTLQAATRPAMERARDLGFKVGLHTAAPHPRRLLPLLGTSDWVGFDIKALPEDYPAVTAVPRSGTAAWIGLDMLIDSGVDYEVRTTIHSELLDRPRLQRLADRLARLGVTNWALQACRTQHGNAHQLKPNRWPDTDDLDFVERELRPRFASLVVRMAA